MKTKLLTILILTSSIFIANVAFAQKPLDIAKPYKIKPRGIIQKPIEKVTPQRHIRPERVINKGTRDHCEEGYVDDCSGDGNCCPESWIGDGWLDCDTELNDGCDLSCYDNDGGDCCGNNYCDLPETEESCPEDCPDDCPLGFVDDCSGDGDCCPDSMIGDGIPNCQDPPNGCDLSCYDNDGGDCTENNEYDNCDYCPYTGGYPGNDCCDTAWYEYGLTCNEMESIYYWDCDGCICPGDGPPECGDSFCNGDETYEDCPEDCNAPGECEDGEIADCDGTAECWPESWIGDGYPDCSDQQYNADLTCYDCDGGDCSETDPGCTGEDPYCGDGWCDTDESFENCPEDCEDDEYNNCDYCPYTGGYPGNVCCDTAWFEYGLTCNELESIYNWDCDGCICPGDPPPECGDGYCNGDETYEDCPEDCNAPGECPEGEVADCSGDGDCCPESWIGDDFADCSDQQWGCDLTCYDCDGGDCIGDPYCEETDDCCSLGDYNCDNNIDVLDIVAIVNCVLEDAECPCGDIDGDGAVNVLDIVQLVNMILGGE
ncbi:MAG: hypothetical protein H8E85_05470 [Candidatus Marinimicrobia bacterium]|nr:hypothetical protein [Candidatus Neomarinimicrobiota bacterium]